VARTGGRHLSAPEARAPGTHPAPSAGSGGRLVHRSATASSGSLGGVAGCGRPACHTEGNRRAISGSWAPGPPECPGRARRRPPRARAPPRRPPGRRRGPGRCSRHRARPAQRNGGARTRRDPAGGGGAAAGGGRGRRAAAGARRPAGGDQPPHRLGPDRRGPAGRPRLRRLVPASDVNWLAGRVVATVPPRARTSHMLP
jgi:hypothetical protein